MSVINTCFCFLVLFCHGAPGITKLRKLKIVYFLFYISEQFLYFCTIQNGLKNLVGPDIFVVIKI